VKAVNNTNQAWHFLGETSGGIYVVRSHETIDFFLDPTELFTVTVYDVDGTEVRVDTGVSLSTDSLLWAVAPSDAGASLIQYEAQYTGIATTYDIPVIGEVTTPDWALVSPEMAVFFLGFATALGIRLLRACLRWFKRSADPGDNQ